MNVILPVGLVDLQSTAAGQACRVHQLCKPEVIRLETIEQLRPEPGEVPVRAKAAGVGAWDSWIRRLYEH